MSELLLLHQRLISANGPEEFFGATVTRDEAHGVFRRVARVAHEDRYLLAPEKKVAAEAMMRLNLLWSLAQERFKAGVYGTKDSHKPASSFIKTRLHSYVLTHLTVGDVTNVFSAKDEDGKSYIIKASKHASVNNILKNEAQMLKELTPKSAFFKNYFPQLVESCVILDARSERHVNIFVDPGDYLDLVAVRKHFPLGLPGEHIVWVGNRLITALQNNNLVHGAVLPPHILVNPENHGGMLIGWGQAVKVGQPLTVISNDYRTWYPPEVFAKKPLTPATDVFMLAKCLMGLARRDFSIQLLNVLRGCVIPNPARRPHIDDVSLQWRDAARAVYGKRKFVPLKLEAIHG